MQSENSEVLPFRVGVAEDVVLKDGRREKPRNRDRRVVQPDPAPPPALFIAGQGESHAEAPKVLDSRGEEVSSMTWPSFLAWRKTKCRPYDYESGPKVLSPRIGEDAMAIQWMHDGHLMSRDRVLEEIDQATHELVGEVAELAELFIEHGPTVFFGEKRAQLIDECGDIFFCAAWALDAWGLNPLYEADDLEILRVADDSDLAAFAGILAQKGGEVVLKNPKFVSALGGTILNLMLNAQANAGLLCNAFKKLKFQRREQDVEVQAKRIITALFMVNQILIIANSSVEEALQANQRKLNARYPDGYVAGMGGGIRTGEGK